MELQEIEVTIDKNGQVQIHIQGVQGMACLELSKDLEEALGGSVISRELTAEAAESPQKNPLAQKTKIHISK